VNFKDFRLLFSSPRISRYLAATGNDNKRTIKLYKANLRLAQAFHPLLGIVEVVIRNRLNDVISAHFTDPDWIINQKSGFMSDPSISPFLRNEIAKIEIRLKKRGIAITSGKIISELPFGFWSELFERNQYKLLLGKPIQIFTHLPSETGRKEIFASLNSIRTLRNRINHNEPICFNEIYIDTNYASETHREIIRILNLINPNFTIFIKDVDIVQKCIDRIHLV